MDMSRRGRKRQLFVEAENWALILSSVGTVGRLPADRNHRKTGYR